MLVFSLRIKCKDTLGKTLVPGKFSVHQIFCMYDVVSYKQLRKFHYHRSSINRRAMRIYDEIIDILQVFCGNFYPRSVL